MSPAKVRMRDGAAVILSFSQGARSLLAVRTDRNTFELWVVEDGWLQSKIPHQTRDDLAEAIDEWQDWLSGKRRPSDALH